VSSQDLLTTTSGAGVLVASAADAARLIRTDSRLAHWSVVDRGVDYLEIEHGSVFLVLIWPPRWLQPGELDLHLIRSRSGNYHLLLFGSDDDFAALRVEEVIAPGLTLVPAPAPLGRFLVTLRGAGEACRLRREAAALELDLDRARYENDMLISIGRALSQQRNIRSLLEIILSRAREVTGADAGSIYVVEGDDEDQVRRTLRFMVSQNDSIEVESRDYTMPVSERSIVGRCVLNSDVINIADLYALDAPGSGNNPWGFVHNRSFDDKHGYQTRSMLTVPMISARQQVIGVIQLINKRGRGQSELNTPSCFNTGVVPFDEVSENHVTTLASQAGIALENALLYDEVKTLFEGFVRASVTAIESRDPTTSGHSERVATLTVGLAKATERVDTGAYADLYFTSDQLKQIEYAALLHDFGKVGVREHVLVKAKKLYTHQRDLILQRFHFIRAALENEQLQRKVSYLVEKSREGTAAELSAHLVVLESETARRIAEVDEFVQFIMHANEPTVLEQGGFERIADIAARRFVDGTGLVQPYLTDDEAAALQILRGSLTQEERAEIESHVVHTYNFLKQIPWGKTFRDIPEIAGAHHEKLDGSGYPRRLEAPRIPAPARMMTISDIYDALTASDRPYKKAMPVERALDILSWEVNKGLLDSELFQVFVDARIYELTR
jgi:HD-GYP domain-containing protein (c-di-GMP phosphodiesterase class II)